MATRKCTQGAANRSCMAMRLDAEKGMVYLLPEEKPSAFFSPELIRALVRKPEKKRHSPFVILPDPVNSTSHIHLSLKSILTAKYTPGSNFPKGVRLPFYFNVYYSVFSILTNSPSCVLIRYRFAYRSVFLLFACFSAGIIPDIQ